MYKKGTKQAAIANNCSAMETETIQKNGTKNEVEENKNKLLKADTEKLTSR